MDDGCKIGCIHSAIALSSDMKWLFCILGETRIEQLKEGVYIQTGSGAVVDGRIIVRIRETDIYGLIEEDDVGMSIPAVWIEGRIQAIVDDITGPQFKKESSGRTTSWTTVQPENEWCRIWRFSRLEEPMRASADIVLDRRTF